MRRDGEAVRLFTRRGYDWTDRYPAIAAAAAKLRARSFTLDGEDLRPLPLGKREKRLARLLARVRAGIAINEHTDENGAVVFLHAWMMGLEGIMSKRLSAPYRSCPSRDWIKVKNPDSPAMMRHREGRW